jgi:hypothetical protein
MNYGYVIAGLLIYIAIAVAIRVLGEDPDDSS